MNKQYIVAATQPEDQPVSTKNLQFPFEWTVGTIITVLALSVPLVLWVSKIRTDLNATEKELEKHKIDVAKELEDTKKILQEQRQTDRASISSELKISSQEIINQFNLISQEFRLSMVGIGEKLTQLGRDQCRKEETVNHLRNDMREMREKEKENSEYLNQMRQYIPEIDRRDRGTISKPKHYDES